MSARGSVSQCHPQPRQKMWAKMEPLDSPYSSYSGQTIFMKQFRNALSTPTFKRAQHFQEGSTHGLNKNWNGLCKRGKFMCHTANPGTANIRDDQLVATFLHTTQIVSWKCMLNRFLDSTTKLLPQLKDSERCLSRLDEVENRTTKREIKSQSNTLDVKLLTVHTCFLPDSIFSVPL